jgi:hypothetical protein
MLVSGEVSLGVLERCLVGHTHVNVESQDGVLLSGPLETSDLGHQPELRLLGLLGPLALLLLTLLSLRCGI